MERVIGTLMTAVHDLPGTTFSNPGERGRYDSGAKAVLTLRELQRWLALAVGTYHGSVHAGLGCTPAGRWADGVPADGAPVLVSNETAFLVDFLPVVRRTLTRSGFLIEHVHYFSDALKPWIGRRSQLDRFVIRRDPRDISRVWVLDPQSGSHLQVPYRTLSRPPISIWEHRAALARLRELGHAQVDERALFAMVEQMRSITDTAARTTRKARRDVERRTRTSTTTGTTRGGDALAPDRAATAAAAAPPAPDVAGRPWHGGGRGAVRGDRAVVSADGVLDDVVDELVVGELEDLSHLHQAARPVARLPAAERLRYLRADRWIGYTGATRALDRLETLFEWPGKQRMPNLLLIGPTNNGKSMIIEKFRRTHPPTSAPDGEQIPVLVVQMPSSPSPARFYVALLAAMGAPLRPRQRLAELEQVTLELLRAVWVRVLVIDELHNVLAGRGDTRREFLNLLRFLGNELGIPLVGVGTREAYLAIRSDDQLENRFEPHVLPLWQPDEQARSLLASFAASFPLRRPSPIATPDMARYLLTRSEGTIGELTALLTDAAVAAIESGQEAIDQATLVMAQYAGPTERRRLFERELA